MRIIGGTLGGRTIRVPTGLKLRPTTEQAREALFNILQSRMVIEGCKVLDLFAGTGLISFEFASRGARSVTAVDSGARNARFISGTSDQLGLGIEVIREDVFSFLKRTTEKFDLIFADPPYDLPVQEQICGIVQEKLLLIEGGLLVIEHGERQSLDKLNGFQMKRRYGGVVFSFFRF